MKHAWRGLAAAMLVTQITLAARVAFRMLATAGGTRIGPATGASADDRVSVIVPVLNERGRLAPCLEGLLAQGPEVAEILVVDGDSSDGTDTIVDLYTTRDARVRLLRSPPPPYGGNGKAQNLAFGLAHADPESAWVLTIDADVRPAPGLGAALMDHARAENVEALSVATQQRLSGAAEALLHPAMLATLVYRYGIPGQATDDPAAVQANGQCFLARRNALLDAGGFEAVLDSVCEDVTLARILATTGRRVGFYETDGLVAVAMYAGAGDAWRNWLRSLPMRDRFWGLSGWLGLAEIIFVQGAPLPLALMLARLRGTAGLWGRVNAMLVVMRVGVLVGASRAYEQRPWTYWLSPLSDLPVVVGVLLSAVRRNHRWRGRSIARGDSR